MEETKNKESPMTKDQVEKEVKDRVAAECFAMFLALIKLGYNTSEAGRVVFDGVEMYSKEVGRMLKEAAKESK